jgi:Protein of unknown function (DUF1015)
MNKALGFRLPHLCLPRQGIDLMKWAVIACDQHTAEPEYWEQVAALVGDAPSTLHLTLPEVYLGAADVTTRIAAIQDTMRRYLADGLLRDHAGPVLVERDIGGRVRRGLMLELDLEHYDFDAASTSLIRPTEGTIVARLAPRIEVRRDAALELPHILVLIDDPQRTVIEPIAAASDDLAPLYESELMLAGGHITGRAVDAARAAAAARALQALARPEAFAARYGLPAGTPPMLFAMGDGNHSLATAKLIWQQHKAAVGMGHPSRFALVEVLNIHDPALDVAPIHRLLFGVSADVRDALARHFGGKLRCTDAASPEEMRRRVAAAEAPTQAVGLIGPGTRCSVVEIADPPARLALGTLQPFIDAFVEAGHARELDYVHGDEVLESLARAEGNTGFHFAALGKSELLKRVIEGGPLPRKTFSMGEAHEKRYYVEARRLRA